MTTNGPIAELIRGDALSLGQEFGGAGTLVLNESSAGAKDADLHVWGNLNVEGTTTFKDVIISEARDFTALGDTTIGDDTTPGVLEVHSIANFRVSTVYFWNAHVGGTAMASISPVTGKGNFKEVIVADLGAIKVGAQVEIGTAAAKVQKIWVETLDVEEIVGFLPIVFPEVSPTPANGANSTFTTVAGKKFQAGRVMVIHNSAILAPGIQFDEDPGRTSVTISPSYAGGTPTGTIMLFYVEDKT
jgi:hypothetical protein